MESTSNKILPLRGGAPRDARPTFLELAEEWLRTEGARLVRPEDVHVHVRHLRPIWSLTEEALRPAAVKRALYALLAPEGVLGPPTVNKVRSTGRRIIREAQLNDRWMGQNPFELVRRLRQVRPIMRHLTLAEAQALLPHLRHDRRREVLLMLHLGLRPGEWKALQRVDVDLATRTMIVRRSNGRDSTKTGKSRTIPIPDALAPHLEEALWEVPPDCPLVFPGREGRRQDEHAKLSRMLKAAMKRADLVQGYEYVCRRKGCGHRAAGREKLDNVSCPLCRFRLWRVGVPLPVRYYDLRHSAATLHREAGADPLAIQLVLGHAPETLTDSVYTHLSLDYVRREMNRLRI